MAQAVVEGCKADLKEREKFWREVFHNADKNGDKSVDVVELKNSLNTARRAKNLKEFDDKEIASIFSDVDRDGNRKLTENEFVTEMLKPARRSAFRECFKNLDKDENGKLSLTEVKQLYAKFDKTDEEIRKILSKVDTDADGFISYDEFMKLV